MAEVKSCSGEVLPVFAKGTVSGCSAVNGAVPSKSVWYLKVNIQSENSKTVPCPKPGQFYMLKASKSGVLLGRPVSVYGYRCISETDISVEFLILKKRKGTQELVSLENGDGIELIGPLGNFWPEPKDQGGEVIDNGSVSGEGRTHIIRYIKAWLGIDHFEPNFTGHALKIP